MGNLLIRWWRSRRTKAKASQPRSQRSLPVDALRGLIMVLMALDHANYFVAQKHPPGEQWGGQFPIYHDSLAFLTRLATHVAAPGFFLLMGLGMALFAQARRKQGWSRLAIVVHLAIRGGLLMALQLLVINRAWEFWPPDWDLETYIGVLFALGGTMILGSLLLWLKPRFLLPLTLVLVVGTELLVPAPEAWGETFGTLHRVLLVSGGNIVFNADGDLLLWVNYPILPWLELVTFGMVLGYWLADGSRKAFKRALWLGTACLLGFLVIRYFDGFGNIRPRAGDTWIDFLNVVKYPPSIVFTLMTTGVNLLILGVFGHLGAGVRRILRPLAVLGQVPLFFYVTHLFLYAGLGYWLEPRGTSVAEMYPYWLLGLVVLFPLCWLYGRFKHSRPPKSLWRFI